MLNVSKTKKKKRARTHIWVHETALPHQAHIALSEPMSSNWPAGFESRLVPDLPSPLSPFLIGLRAFDLVSSRVWWEASTNIWPHPNVWCILWCFKIPVGRDPKKSNYIFRQSKSNSRLNGPISTLIFNGPNLTDSFQNPQILWTISSGHDVIYILAAFFVRGFIMTNCDCHILCSRA